MNQHRLLRLCNIFKCWVALNFSVYLGQVQVIRYEIETRFVEYVHMRIIKVFPLKYPFYTSLLYRAS